jgi:hypothetical protein
VRLRRRLVLLLLLLLRLQVGAAPAPVELDVLNRVAQVAEGVAADGLRFFLGSVPGGGDHRMGGLIFYLRQKGQECIGLPQDFERRPASPNMVKCVRHISYFFNRGKHCPGDA